MLGAIEEGLRDHLKRLRECHACANPKCITPTFWRVSDTSVNAVLAFIEGAAPRDEVEAALAIQMACTYAVTMAVLSRLDGAFGGDRGMAIRAAAAARLLNPHSPDDALNFGAACAIQI
jgi:hypothetical protein